MNDQTLKPFKQACLTCIITCVIILILAVFQEKYNSYLLTACFEDKGYNRPYAQETPLHEMRKLDFRIYEHSLPADGMVANPNLIEQVVLPCDVEYYTYKEDDTPAIVLKEGTVVFFFPDESHVYIPHGYGAVGWPDYEKEWRYAYPFSEEGFKLMSKDMQMYYVKAEQLESVARAWYYTAGYRDGILRNASKYARGVTQTIDVALYYNGHFCSPYLDWREIEFPNQD